MGLFGLIKAAGEEISVRVREWFGRDYVVATLGTAGGLLAGATAARYVEDTVKPTKEETRLAVSVLTKLVTSGALYYLLKGFSPILAFSASLGSAAGIVLDLIDYFRRKQGQPTVARWLTYAAASAGVSAQAVVAVVKREERPGKTGEARVEAPVVS